MTFLLGIISIFSVLQLLNWLGLRFNYINTAIARMRISLAVMFMVSGSMHFTNPEGFLAMMPPFLPIPLVLIFLTGVLEMLGAISLLIPLTQRVAGLGLVGLLLAIFPANIYAALATTGAPGALESSWYPWLRLPLQGVFISLMLWSISKPMDTSKRSKLFSSNSSGSRA